MSNLVTVNSGSAIDGSLKAGRVSISTDSTVTPSSGGKTWYNMINPAEGYVFISDPKVQGYTDGSPIIYPTQTLLPADILGTINGLPDRRGSVPFDNVWDALKWTGQSGKYFTLKNSLSGIPSDGLVFYVNADSIVSYPQDDTVWYDLSGNNYHLTVTNGPVFNPDGYFENDVDSYFTGTGGANIPTSNDPYTMVVIARQVEQWGSADGLISIGGFYATNQSNALRTLNNNVGHFHHYWWGNDLSLSNNNAGLALGKWFMVAASFDGTTRRIWVNGISRASAGASGHNVTSTTIQVSKTVATEYQEGDVAEALIYDKALSSDEMLQLYHKAPIVTDNLALALDPGNLISYPKSGGTVYNLVSSAEGTLTNGVGYSQDYGSYFDFDGTNDQIVMNNESEFDFTDAIFTVEYWFRCNRDTGTTQILVNKARYGANGRSFETYLQSGLSIRVGGFNGSWTYVVGPVIKTNEWYHFVFTSDGSGNAYIYLNGDEVANSTSFNTTLSNTADPVDIGAYGSGGAPFDGQMGPVRLYSKYLTPQEVAQNYNAERPRFKSSRDITKEGLVLHLDAHDPNSYISGNTWTDLSGNGFDASLQNGPAYNSNGGGAIYFDRTDDIGRLGYHSELLPNDITQEAWVKARNFENWHGIISNMSGWGTGFSLQIGTTQNIAAMVSGDYLRTSWTPQTNVWYHIVATHRSSDNLNVLYVNGVQENSSTRAISYNTNQVTDIGCFYTGGSLRLDGEIAVIRTYNRALSAQEVLNNYLSQAPRFSTTKKINPLDYSLVLDLDAGNTTSYPRTGTTWYDRSGKGNHATLTNGPTYLFENGGVISFDGSDDTANIGSSAGFNITDEMSVFAWVKLDSNSGWKGIFGGAVSGFVHFQLYNGGINVYVYGPAAPYANPDGVTIGTNVWNHIGFTFGNNTLKVYLNGEQLPTEVTGNGSNITSNSDVRVGWAYATSRLMQGKIPSVKVYNKALPSSEVLENYKSTRSRFGNDGIVTSNLDLSVDFGNVDSYDNSSTTINDLSGNNNNGTLVNGPVFSPEVGGNASFDDTDDYITFGNPSITQYTYATDFSLEVWINPDTVSGFKHLIGKSYGNYRLAQNGTGVSFRLDTNVLTTQSGTLVIGKWTHIVATYEASTKTARVYQDGALITTSSNSNLDWTSGSGNFQLGNSPGENYYFGGKIALGRAYGKKLTDAEVLQNYTALKNRFGKD